MSDEELLTGTQEFNHVSVYQRRGGDAPVYIVRFQNWEIPEGMIRGAFGTLAIAALMIGGMYGGFWVMDQGLDIGIGWFLPLIPWIGLCAWGIKKVQPPWNYKRAIEIDIAGDALRVYRNKTLTTEQQLSRLANLTVEPHPETEWAREDRMLKKQKSLRWQEKQHCLFGHFGIGGAQKICLVCKVEWPNKNSLAEAQAAIMWARERGQQDLKKRQTGPAARPGAERKTGRKGMRPPLD